MAPASERLAVRGSSGPFLGFVTKHIGATSKGWRWLREVTMRSMSRWSCCVLVASLATAMTGCQSRGSSAEPQPITHALVSTDGRSITVPAIGGGCFARAVLTASQTPSAVRLRLTTLAATSHDVVCTADVRVLQASTRLRKPLGRRHLIDTDTGRQIRFIPGKDLATPTWLPRGASRPQNSPINGWTRTYFFPSRLHRAPLTIQQNPRRFADRREFPTSSGVLTHLALHGHPALLWVENQGPAIQVVRLGWHAGGYWLIVESTPLRAHQRPLSPSAITRVATNLTVRTG